MVLAVDRDRLPAVGDLPVERVDVPSQNLTDVEGRVVAHPVGRAAPDPDDQATETGGFVREDARERAMTLLGVPEDDIEESEMVRIVRRGDEDLPVTMDLRPGRLNLELDDDGTGTYEVTRVLVEVPDGAEPLVVEWPTASMGRCRAARSIVESRRGRQSTDRITWLTRFSSSSWRPETGAGSMSPAATRASSDARSSSPDRIPLAAA